MFGAGVSEGARREQAVGGCPRPHRDKELPLVGGAGQPPPRPEAQQNRGDTEPQWYERHEPVRRGGPECLGKMQRNPVDEQPQVHRQAGKRRNIDAVETVIKPDGQQQHEYRTE